MPHQHRDRPVWLWWTGGKDSAWALHLLRAAPEWEVRGLVAPVNRANRRVAMHGVRVRHVERQASAAGLRLRTIRFDWTASVAETRATLATGLASTFRGRRRFVGFGDLHSAGDRKHRSALAEAAGVPATFPLWGRDPGAHAAAMLEAGLEARVCCVETARLPARFAGRRFDESFLADLPDDVDPCGENGEFHTFVEWAPGWSRRVPSAAGAGIEAYGFALAEIERPRTELIEAAENPGGGGGTPSSTTTGWRESANMWSGISTSACT